MEWPEDRSSFRKVKGFLFHNVTENNLRVKIHDDIVAINNKKTVDDYRWPSEMFVLNKFNSVLSENVNEIYI